MARSWILQFVLPNLVLAEPIEGDCIALVPNEDPRLDPSRSGASGRLLANFTDPFGNNLKPAALITCADEGGKRPHVEALMAFRNAVAIATLTVQWSLAHQQPGNVGNLYSDSFELYPISPSRDNTRLSLSSAVVAGISPADSFRGQCSAEIVHPQHNPLTLKDHTLLPPLLGQWRRRFLRHRKEWKTTALFRSLALAFQSARAPADNRGLVYDLGMRTVLWVAAFEALVHPGRSGRSDLGRVLDLLASAEWTNRRLAAARFRVVVDGKPRKVTFCGKLYRHLYGARNDFAHGNPINLTSIFPFGDRRLPPLHSVAPLIYRAALNAHLGVPRWTGRLTRRYVESHFQQGAYERGLRQVLDARR